MIFFNFQPLSENEVSNIMGQVVDGIRYLHSYNILHRDLSLSNLLLTKDMKVVSLFYLLTIFLKCSSINNVFKDFSNFLMVLSL